MSWCVSLRELSFLRASASTLCEDEEGASSPYAGGDSYKLLHLPGTALVSSSREKVVDATSGLPSSLGSHGSGSELVDLSLAYFFMLLRQERLASHGTFPMGRLTSPPLGRRPA
jgi:hypothetical protein